MTFDFRAFPAGSIRNWGLCELGIGQVLKKSSVCLFVGPESIDSILSVFLLENRSEEPVYASQIKLTMVNLFSINKSCPINNLDLLVKVQNGSELGSCTMPKIVLC